MTLDSLVIITLSSLLVFQQVYFMRQVQKLLDKLMSRSYTEYKLADKPIPSRGIAKENVMLEDMGPLTEFSTL